MCKYFYFFARVFTLFLLVFCIMLIINDLQVNLFTTKRNELAKAQQTPMNKGSKGLERETLDISHLNSVQVLLQPNLLRRRKDTF